VRVDTDNSSRPNLRVKVFGRPKPSLIKRVAKRLLNKVKENITTGHGGRWTPLQYDTVQGKSKGSKALQGTEDQWEYKILSLKKAVVQPKKGLTKIWRGHTKGAKITAKGKGMRFLTTHGYITRKTVKLPRRDPRVTESQMRKLIF